MIASFIPVSFLALSFHSMSTTSDRASASKIRRAAGSKDPSVLPKAIVGWTSAELDDLASQDGKSALHMAAWQGCIENVQFLLEKGCNVNVISTGKYSYGKTPIFFAATRCRNNVVQYLLKNTSARVKIVNNKGQSVLSIASSHLSQTTIDMIQRAEELEEHEWTNYRATHSDDLVYGDLDPRFLERSITQEDVVTPLAINPTTKQSRRGAFAKKNPKKAKELTRRQEKQQCKPTPKPPPTPSPEELLYQEQVWDIIETCIVNGTYETIVPLLVDVVRFEERQRRSWIPLATAKLQSLILESSTDSDNDMVGSKLENAVETFCKYNESNCTIRETGLLQKWMQQVCKAPTVRDDERSSNVETTTVREVSASTQPIHHKATLVNLQLPPWNTACKAVEGLSQSLLQNPRRHASNLSLPEAPMWIDSEQQLKQLDQTLHDHAQQSNTCIVALDTEWYTNEHGDTQVSTIQISIVIDKNDNNEETTTSKQLQTWIVDLLPANDNDSYRDMIESLLHWLFDEDSNVTLLGFAFAHDISMLHTLCGSLSSTKCLDVQKLATQEMKRSKKTLPGLQACSNHYLSKSGAFTLSKEEQCSEWGRRSLRDAQLEYAGLDAAVLLVLLAEIAKSASTT